MTVTDKIINEVHRLPPEMQGEVLDFVGYLKSKIEAREREAWSEFSLANAMRGMESEEIQYSEKDIKASPL